MPACRQRLEMDVAREARRILDLPALRGADERAVHFTRWCECAIGSCALACRGRILMCGVDRGRACVRSGAEEGVLQNVRERQPEPQQPVCVRGTTDFKPPKFPFTVTPDSALWCSNVLGASREIDSHFHAPRDSAHDRQNPDTEVATRHVKKNHIRDSGRVHSDSIWWQSVGCGVRC